MHKIVFKKPYLFEEKQYAEVELAGLEELSGADLCAAQRHIGKTGGGSAVLPEMDYEYTLFLAAKAAGLPIEFFTGLPACEAVKVKNEVSGFLFGTD